MIKILLIISVLPVSVSAFCQTDDRRAMEFYNDGSYKISVKNYVGAIADFTEAIKLDSGFIQAFENRGVAKFQLKDFKGARADYDLALEIDSQDFNTHGRRGWALFYLQDLKGAIDDFNIAIEGARDNVQYYTGRGQAKYQLRDYEGALSDFNRVIKMWYSGKEEKSKALFWRGLLKFDLGKKEEGCLDLKKSTELGSVKAKEVYEGFCTY